MKSRIRSPLSQHGMTLIEVLVVVAIVTLLAAVGYPSYTGYITRANRTAAKSFLLQVADRQEQYFGDNKRYADDLTELGYASNGFAIDQQGTPLPAGAADRIYAISLSNTSPTTFTVNASPQLKQNERDTQCAALMLTHAGQKLHGGPGPGCW